MGTSNSAHVMTLVNSIIGVSILAMPFCYKQCGILLASLILIFSNFMTRLSCHYLLKSAIMTRRRSYELLAFHALGGSGKTIVELSIILLMIGTCIAFFVVMGDLGPAIIGQLLEVDYSAALRPAVLIGLAVLVVLPLGLLRNVDSLSSICMASFLFYLLLVMKVFIESMENLFSSPWTDEVHFWRPAGILQCLPIFSMALSCQTQLLEIFDSLQNGTLDKMNSIVKSAINLCTALYMSVGFLGYVAYYKTSFTGNLLMSFSASHFSEFIKLGFVLSVAVTFPLVIFPCRTSLHSLLFKKVHTPHYELVTGGGNHIPEAQFRCITFFIITSSLIVGLLAPNIEIVLGLLGSTIGVIICILCPPFIFMWTSTKVTTEKALARMMCLFGLFIMVMGTYANLYLSDSPVNEPSQNRINLDAKIPNIPDDLSIKRLEDKEISKNIQKVDEAPLKKNMNSLPKEQKSDSIKVHSDEKASLKKVDDKRVEPPIPQYPEIHEAPLQEKKPIKVETKKSEEVEKVAPDRKTLQNTNEKAKVLHESVKVSNTSGVGKSGEKIETAVKPVNKIEANAKPFDPKPLNSKSDANSAGPNKIQKLVEEQPPLPLLMKAQENADAKGQLSGQRNVLDREKRDLYYVTNLTHLNALKTLDTENSFVKKVAENNNDGKVCKKDGKVAKDEAKKENVQSIQNENPGVGGPIEKVIAESPKKPPTLDTEVKYENKSSDGVPESLMKPKTDDLPKVETKKNLIMSPSKLTDPNLQIQEILHVDENKPGENLMSQKLKTIDKETGNRKK